MNFIDSRESYANHARFARIWRILPDRFDLAFLGILALDICVLLFIINGASVSFNEIKALESGANLVAKIAQISIERFGANDFALKLPNLALNAANLTLIYLISLRVLKFKKDALLCVCVYAALPAVIMQGVILNETTLMLFIVLLICYIELVDSRIAYPIFALAIFIDSSAFMLFLALFCYAIFRRKFKSAIFAAICLIANLLLFGIDVGGLPRGRFLDVIAEFSLLYSPPLFVFYIYTLYRNMTKNPHSAANLMLFISVTSIVVSIVLSVRQEVDKEIFMFMSLCGIPLMIRQFLSEIRVRLPAFQGAYKNRFIIVLAVLIFEASLLVFSRAVCANLNRGENFLAQFYIAKEVAAELKARNISRVKIADEKMQARLGFYGIKKGGQPLRRVKKGGNIIIQYGDKVVERMAI